jgi:glycosyltransferase involved in cell wall biosynthesis
VDQAALSACDLAIFSNQWAADLAVKLYEVDPAKIRVVTYGANLRETPDRLQIEEFLRGRKPQQITCIFIGWDWYRKGAEKAIATVGALRARGLDVSLRILGCFPPPGFVVPDYVSVLGTIPKFTSEGRERIAKLFGESHLLILPTRAECAAVVLSECSAFGVPVVSSDVGGNSSLVRQNVNGILLPPEAPVSSWADAAMRIVGQRDTYEQFVRQSHRMFEEELSWLRSVSRFEEAIFPLLRRRVTVEVERSPSDANCPAI